MNPHSGGDRQRKHITYVHYALNEDFGGCEKEGTHPGATLAPYALSGRKSQALSGKISRGISGFSE